MNKPSIRIEFVDDDAYERQSTRAKLEVTSPFLNRGDLTMLSLEEDTKDNLIRIAQEEGVSLEKLINDLLRGFTRD